MLAKTCHQLTSSISTALMLWKFKLLCLHNLRRFLSSSITLAHQCVLVISWCVLMGVIVWRCGLSSSISDQMSHGQWSSKWSVCLHSSTCSLRPTVNQRVHISLTAVSETAHNQASSIWKSRKPGQPSICIIQLHNCFQICSFWTYRRFPTCNTHESKLQVTSGTVKTCKLIIFPLSSQARVKLSSLSSYTVLINMERKGWRDSACDHV